MAEALILEFTGIGEEEYNAVNAKLGIDMASGTGDWPEGMLSHAAGRTDSDTFAVIEVWSSRDAQAAFMQTRLGDALAAGGVTAPPSVTWVSLVAFHSPDAP
jgi:hypothetical protein